MDTAVEAVDTALDTVVIMDKAVVDTKVEDGVWIRRW